MVFVFCFFTFVLGWFLRSLFARYEINKTLDRFQGVSAEALRQNNTSFVDLAKTAMQPIQESLEKVDGKIHELEKVRVGAYSSLKTQVDSLLQSQKDLHIETANLVKALRAPMVRGRWGEVQLKRVVEMAGMLNHCDFFEQASKTTEEGRFRPDLLVKLPGGKQIIVDAKAPLEAYLEAIECKDEVEKKKKLKLHAAQIRNHIQLLSRKSYWEQFSSTPEFVVLFLPGETFFSAALEQDPSLIEAGAMQQVILATPTTLIALLRSVAYGWRQESISRSAEEVSKLGKELYKRLADLGGHFSKVGKGLTQAVQSYNKAMGTFESRVLVSARRFKELGSSSEIEPIESVDHTTRECKELQNIPSDD
ncbi:MAG: hypothetical protein S4CHLAM45_08160 [Chlamydiales bacterium]|nr:hypothetical protein [Chlamydiales bacterium]MCH9620432.1 hypothetical protein [Chlamydiales bacterium]MCH9622922.1 hypothetical protein [Chlamydiales bacterium]